MKNHLYALVLLLLTLSSMSASASPQNILFCISDDQSWAHTSAYGCWKGITDWGQAGLVAALMDIVPPKKLVMRVFSNPITSSRSLTPRWAG